MFPESKNIHSQMMIEIELLITEICCPDKIIIKLEKKT